MIRLEGLILNTNFDVFHPTYYDLYFLNYIKKKPFVVTIHDTIYEVYPEMFSSRDNAREGKNY